NHAGKRFLKGGSCIECSKLYHSKTPGNIRRRLFNYYQGKCAYCGRPGHHIEHVDPRFNGGEDSISNYVLACRECNHRKGTRSIERFLGEEKAKIFRFKLQSRQI